MSANMAAGHRWCAGAGTVLVSALLAVLAASRLASAEQVIVRNMTMKKPLNHMVVDKTGHVYLGAVNALYKLNPDLTEITDIVKTGPIQDNLKCEVLFVSGNKCGNEYKKSTDNYNKVLVLDTDNERLLTCGSVQQGTCQFRMLSNITEKMDCNTLKSQYVAANDAASSTIAFIAPGPPDPSRNKVVYSASTYTGPYVIRKDVPIIATRKLTGTAREMLTYVHTEAISFRGSYLMMDSKFRDFNITYVAGFNVGKFNYFLSVQRMWNTTSSNGGVFGPFITKIIRICENDLYMVSYVEIPLECGEYNILQAANVSNPGKTLATQMQITVDDTILVAAFTRAETAQSDSQHKSPSTGICVYSFKTINKRFEENIRNCFMGQSRGSRIVNHIKEGAVCRHNPLINVNSTFCVTMLDINNPIDGGTPMSTSPVIAFEPKITAVAVSLIEEHTIAFLGTSTGSLKKLVIQRDGAGVREVEELSIRPGHPILRDMKFAPDLAHLYVMASDTVYKVQVSDCNRHKNCTECAHISSDPYCGWCSLSRKCSKKAECNGSSLNKFWLSQKAWDCVQIRRVDPDHASLASQVTITLSVDQLPEGGREDYVCMFNSVEVTVVDTDGTRLQCITPPSSADLPQITSGQDHVNVVLGIKSVRTGIIFVERTFTFYNCSKHNSCTMCTMAQWRCNWCVYDNRCISSSEFCTGSRSSVSRPRQCPQLLVPAQPILVAVGYRSEIFLRGRNLPSKLSDQQGYKCILRHRTPPDTVNARLINDNTIICDAKKYTYIPDVSEMMAKVEVVWNNKFYIEDQNDIQVTFYKCSVMGKDCSLCMSLSKTRPQYNCRWCGADRCQYGSLCKAPPETIPSRCPQPTLHHVMPLTGPLGGNTLVNITGSNLGITFKQIDGGVTVAGKPCRPVRSGYKTARQIMCRTSAVMAPTEGPVIVKIGDSNSTWSGNFIYQDPVLESIHPKVGPMAGFTEVTVMGRALNTGSKIVVMFDSLPCNITEKHTYTMLTCLTSPVSRPRTTNSVKVMFDGDVKRLKSGATFNYTFNPNITSIYPKASYLAGGRTLTVEGHLLKIIQTPKMFLISGEKYSNETSCQTVNDTQMFCKTPEAEDLLKMSRQKRQAVDMPLRIGFRMDGVMEVRDLKDLPWVDGEIKIWPNPSLTPFPSGKRDYTGGALVIKGDGMTHASTMSEIQVTVGGKKWEIESLSDKTIVCHPPETESVAQENPFVIVKIGNAQYPLGLLKYQSRTDSGEFPETATIGIAIIGSILVLTIIVILIIYRRKSTEAERQFRKMQIQLDTLESNVRNECKQAFAELQTEVTDLTSDLNVTGIPFWDYKAYTFKVLFPSHTDHPVLHNKLDQMHNSTMKRPAGQELGLQQFNQLLNSRQFLISFIRTLEAQRNFSIRDKAVVASLLMIVLQDKMEYATEILKVLLSELIDKSVENKHPKLMLRRTESVVEKFLTNWLSICMYSYLKKHAGKSMFLLYKAIKHQTEKGPVDAITSEARYSLSEDRLLREKIEPKTLTINLVVEHEAEMVTCKVLDCDTITQAKEKCLDAIYMNTPCSRRPAVYDVDLEWRSGRSGHLPLQDEDVTTQMVSGWKRINTLSHYHVPDGAIMAISPTRNKNDLIRHQHGMVEITPGSPFSGIKPIVTVEEGHKVWHLVKHDDLQNQSRTQKVISEIFLTRLLSTKGTLQQFIDDLFLMILKVDNSVPPAIKYLFDFLDQAARRHNIVDSEVVHTWKSNSLPLRFWVNLIKNPEFVFDIRKSNIVDSCLSVIAQTFMDSCSTMEHRLGKDSPSNKLLFARDIPKYRKWVEKFYKEVAEMPPVSDHEMNEAMIELSTQNVVDFNVPCALKELYRYALQYNVELLEALDEDSSARKLQLANKFEQVTSVMDGTPLY